MTFLRSSAIDLYLAKMQRKTKNIAIDTINKLIYTTSTIISLNTYLESCSLRCLRAGDITE